MSLMRKSYAMIVCALVGWSSSHALAQRADDGSDRFFTNKVETESKTDEASVVQGSITSTTFVFNEFGGPAQGYDDQRVDNYSPQGRLFTDLRTRLDAMHLGGGAWELHFDARVRVTPGCQYNSNFLKNVDCEVQGGSLGGNEYDAREVYAKRTGEKLDLYLGRQYVYDLAATKIDGVRVHYRTNDTWQLIGFAGLNPAKFSRSIQDDYPAAKLLNDQPARKRILPVAAGVGAGYRSDRIYGALGAVGVMPLADDRETELGEAPRVFLTDTGYWRQSDKLDLYHYLVVDLQSAAGFGVTNASLGANFHPIPTLNINASVNRVDTETLNSIAQSELFEPNAQEAAVPYNYERVLRVASDSARLSVSLAFAEQRFELSTSGQVRQREEVTLPNLSRDMPPTLIPATRNAEVSIGLRDRRSIGGMRLGASFTAIFPFGQAVPNRSSAKIARLMGSRMLLDERAELEFDLTFLSSDDIGQNQDCLNGNTLNCYGQARILGVSSGALFYYRFARNWFGIGSLGVGLHSLTDTINNVKYTQPPNILVSGFARLAYRF